MLKKEIKEKMFKIVKEQRFVTFLELEKIFDISISTIKRYSKELAKEIDIILIIRGGISVNYDSYELSHKEKSIINISSKKKIAKKAKDLIKPYDVIFIDAGTTTSEIFKLIRPLEGLKIFTNNLVAASQINIKNVDVYLIGGKIKYNTSASTGSWAINFIKNIRFTKSFIGCNAFDEEFFYTTNLEECLFKKTIINQSENSYILSDTSKSNKNLPYIVSKIKNIELIDEK